MLLRRNVNSKKISKNLLIYSSCIEDDFPEFLEKFNGYTKLKICLEEHHINPILRKIIAIAYKRNIKKIIALTVDGSPHCIQLHFALEEVKRYFNLQTEHYVIEKGELLKISEESVKISRHLNIIEKLCPKTMK